MANYEIIFIVRQDVSSAQVKTLAEGYRSLVQSQGGEVAKVEYCGLRSLAYRIRKNRKGHYVLMHVGAASATLQEMERQLRLNEDVLRFLTVAITSLDPQPSILAQSRSIRERPFGHSGEHSGGREEPPPFEPESESLATAP
ncbi:MAG: 30S ribosomal protein S6 [Alphaproteobacteria bacterium]